MLARYLRRRTASLAYEPAIDGMRFIAIALVVLHHIAGYAHGRYALLHSGTPGAMPSALETIAHNGSFGVQLFFAISGLVLGWPFVLAAAGRRPPIAIGAYFRRRVTRLEPPFLLAVAFLVVAQHFVLHLSWTELRPHAIATAAYAHELVFHAPSTLSVVTWSLEVEVQWYLLAPLFFTVYRIRNVSLRYAAFVTLWGASLFVAYNRPASWPTSLADQLTYFVAGLVAAELIVRPPAVLTRTWVSDALAAIGWSVILAVFLDVLPMTLLPAACLVAYACTLLGARIRRPLEWTSVAIIGGMCYTIYLWHYTLISAIGRVATPLIAGVAGFEAFFSLQVLLVVGPTLLACVVLYLLIERPCMNPNWPTSLARAIRGGPPAPKPVPDSR